MRLFAGQSAWVVQRLSALVLLFVLLLGVGMRWPPRRTVRC